MKSIVPELRINLIHSDHIIDNNDYELIQKSVDNCILKYSKIYPNFLITYLNIYFIQENDYQIDECSIEFTYLNEILSFSQLNDNEKIYISKEKIKIIKLKEFFEELKLQPYEENDTNISIIGETYRELRNNFFNQPHQNKE